MDYQPSSTHYRLDLLNEGVYAAIARDGGSAICNAGLVDLGDATLIIDTFLTPTAAEDLRADSQRLTGRAPRWVVDTHYHNDHIWGAQVFLPEAELVSSAETRALIQTAGKEEYSNYRAITADRLKDLLAQKSAAETSPGAQTGAQDPVLDMWIGYFRGLARDFPRLRVALPSLVFENHMTLYGSRRSAELIEFKGAHTGSDSVVYLPDDGVVFMSDLLFTGFHPYLGDGSPERWLAVLNAILDGSAGIPQASDRPLRFVPGHGAVGTRADVQRLADYIQTCQQIARALAAEGKGPDDAAAVPIPPDFAGWTMPRFFYANLRFLIEKYQHARDAEPKTQSNASQP